MTRRELLLAGMTLAGAAAAESPRSELSVEAYIFQQYAERVKKSLGAVIPEVIPMARKAGFHNIELNREFLTPELAAGTLRAIGASQLAMPSVYVGGVMHERAAADATIAEALRVGDLCRPFACRAVVHNPSPKPQAAQKTEAELALQVESLNRFGRALSDHELELRVHHHTPEMIANAREWRYILQHTDPQYVSLCLDLDWIHQGDQDPLALLREAGRRVKEVHVRNSHDKLWLESVADGDVDYRAVARYLHSERITPLVVVELAWRDNTAITRPLEENLRRSRLYTQTVFGLGGP